MRSYASRLTSSCEISQGPEFERIFESTAPPATDLDDPILYVWLTVFLYRKALCQQAAALDE
jgi:hypothetical protein